MLGNASGCVRLTGDRAGRVEPVAMLFDDAQGAGAVQVGIAARSAQISVAAQH